MVFGERLSLLVELKHQKVVRRARDPRCDVEMAVSGDSHGGTLNPSLLAPRNDSPQWRVLVIEDAGELLREDAKSRVGQALSRLLNLGDGILGQGLRVIVLITTNEPIQRLHPALLRPGRCLSEIEFRKSTAAECGGEEPLSLAEVMNGVRTPTDASPAGGLYL